MNSELQQWVSNIPRNGDWSKSENKMAFLNAANVMHLCGIPDRQIVDILSSLFRAAAEERDFVIGKDRE